MREKTGYTVMMVGFGICVLYVAGVVFAVAKRAVENHGWSPTLFWFVVPTIGGLLLVVGANLHSGEKR